MAQPDFAPPTGPPLFPGEPSAIGSTDVIRSVVETPSGPTLNLRQLAPEMALRRLELKIVRRLEGFLHGDHLGLLPGPGSDLNDARPYVPGQDDVRRMDWAVTARTNEPHVRDTIADRELEVWALLDASNSMNWGTGGVTKRDLGIAAIATIGFLSQQMGDRFGGFIAHSQHVDRIPARSGRTALYGLLRRMLLDPIEPDGEESSVSLGGAIEKMSRMQRRRGLRVVVSDFLTPGNDNIDPSFEPEWERSLRRLTARNQVLCIEVVDGYELQLPDVGEILIRDPETRFERYLNTSDPAARERFAAASLAQRRHVAAVMRRVGVGHLQLRTDRDWVEDIARFVITYRKTASIIHQPTPGVRS